jgi:predicted ATPase/transcriptional regulator with XRE-family HTH domain
MDVEVRTDPETFGTLLRRYRLAAGLTQEELASRASMSARGISDLERGARTRPQRETIRLLAIALGLDEASREVMNAAGRRGLSTHPAFSAAEAAPCQPWPGARVPVPLDRLIGREAEIRSAVALLLDPGVRLVTLLGTGGIGKTRVAIAAASAVARSRFASIGFVPLGAIADPSLVIPTIASALDLAETSGRTPADRLVTAMQERSTLLVLDTFEQVLHAAPDVSHLLARCPALSILVTSRAPLQVAGERRYRVEPLAVPEAGSDMEAAVVAAVPAVRLFIERARAVDPTFALADDNARDVAGICRKLDGVPLALELAAARIAHLPPALLLPRLEQRLPLLTGGSRDAPPRQRTLRDTIAWSYDLLDPAEQTLFLRLGVFAGGFGLDGAAAVARLGDVAAVGVLDGIASLLDKNLLVRREPLGDEPRFGMLDTIREFALVQLANGGEDQAARDAHAAYMLSLAERAEPELFGAQPEVWAERLNVNHANLVAALTWHEQSGEATSLGRLAGTLREYWFWTGRWSEGRRWTERAARDAAALPDDVAGKVLWAHGYVTRLLGNVTDCVPILERARILRERVGDVIGSAHCVFILGMAATDRADFADAERSLTEAHRIWSDLDDRISAVYAEFHLARAVHGRGDLCRAAAWGEAGYSHAIDLGSVHAARLSAFALVDIATARGSLAEAAAWYWRALRVPETLGRQEQVDLTDSLVLMGDFPPLVSAAALAVAMDDPARAARLLGAAELRREELGALRTTTQELMHDGVMSAIRFVLDEDAIAAALKVGRELPPDAVRTEVESVLVAASGRESSWSAETVSG